MENYTYRSFIVKNMLVSFPNDWQEADCISVHGMEKKKEKAAWSIWTTKPTYCVFSVQKQLPSGSFAKHLEVMKN